VFKMILRNSR